MAETKMANRLGADLKFYKYDKYGQYGESTLLYTIDYANEISYEIESGITWATGGQAHSNMVGFKDTTTGTLTITTQIITDKLKALAAGMDITNFKDGDVVSFKNDKHAVIPQSYIIVGYTMWQDVDGMEHTEILKFMKATVSPAMSRTYTGDGDPQEIEIEFELGTNEDYYVHGIQTDSDEASTFEGGGTATAGIKDAKDLEDALKESGTVKLGANITDGEFTVPADTEVILDLAGYTLESEIEKGSATITVESGATLTIIDGTIKCDYSAGTSTDNAAAIYSEGTLVLDGVTIDSESVGIRAVSGEVTLKDTIVESDYWAIWASEGDVTITIEDGTEISGSGKTVYISGDSDGYSGNYTSDAKTTLIVNGGTITSESESAISTYGLALMESAVIEINGGTINGSTTIEYNSSGNVKTVYPAVYVPNGTVKITGGTINGATDVEVRGGTVEISGGEFNSVITGDPFVGATGNAKTYGYALGIYPYTSTKRDGQDGFDDTVTATVTGGTFNAPLYAHSSSRTYEFEIAGGKFVSDPRIVEGKETSFVANDKTVEFEDGYYVVK